MVYGVEPCYVDIENVERQTITTFLSVLKSMFRQTGPGKKSNKSIDLGCKINYCNYKSNLSFDVTQKFAQLLCSGCEYDVAPIRD